MSIDPPAGSSPSTPSSSPAPKKKKWGKRVLIGAGGLVVIGGVLVLLGPSIASTGMVKSIVLGKVNDQLAGRVDVDDWSLGWFSGIKLSGVKVYDDQKRLAITVNSIKTDLTVLKAIRGDYALGDTVIDSPNLVLVELRPDGTNNLTAIAKQAPAVEVNKVPQGSVAPPKVEDKGGEKTVVIDVPDVKGTVTIKNLTGAVQGGPLGNQPLRIDPSDIKIDVPSLANQPVKDDVKIVVFRDGGKKGSLALNGDIQAIFAGKWDGKEGVNKIKGTQKLTLDNLDLSAAAPVLASAGLAVAGTANGSVDVSLPGNGAADAKGQIVLEQPQVGGDALKGDVYKTDKITLPIQVASSNGADGQPVLDIQQFGIQSADLTSSVKGKISTTALTNLAAQHKPAAAGDVTADFSVPDLAKVSTQLPHLLALGQDVSLRSGALNAHLDLTTATDSAKVAGTLKVENVAGVQAGRAVALDPISVSYDLEPAFSDTGLKALPVTMKLDSSFAKADASGSLDNLTYSANISLDKARQQLGQFVDFGTLEMAGALVASGSLKGDLLNHQPATASVKAELTNVKLTGMQGFQPVNLDRLVADVSDAKVTMADGAGGKTAITADVPGVIVEAGPAGAPVLRLNAAATGINASTSDVAAFELKELTAKLPELQQRFGAFVEALTGQGIVISSGSLSTTVGGSYIGGKLTMTKPLAAQIQGLTVSRQGRPVLSNETLTIGANGVVQSRPSTHLELTTLNVSSSSNLVSVKQQGEKILVDVKGDGSIDGSGGIAFTADLARLGQASAAWSGQQPAQPITSGSAAGQVVFAADAVKGNVDLTALTLGNLVQNEALKATFDVSSKDQFKNLVANANVDSSFVKAGVKDATVSLNSPGIWEMIPNAEITVHSDNIAKIDALSKALMPPAKGPATQPADQPLYATAGTLDAGLSVTSKPGEMIVNIKSLKVDGLSLQKGTASWSLPKPVDFKGQVLVDAATANGATVMQQIKKVVVTEFGGSLGVADLSVPQPITLTELGAATPNVQGSVALTGRIQSVTGLLEVLDGAAPGTVYPYVGDFKVTEALSTQATAASAKGGIEVTNFKLLAQPGATAGAEGFSEDHINISNDVTYDSKSTDLTLRTLKVDMPTSGALTVDASGVIKDTAKSRTFATPIKLTLGYDLAKLLPLVKPMLATTTQAYLEGAAVQGKYTKEFSVSGSYPAGATVDQAVKGLTASGSVTVDKADLPALGVNLANFSPEIAVKGGIVTVASAKPATLNSGTLDIDKAVVDLTKPNATLTLPAKKQVLKDVNLNGVIASHLGKMAFIFADADDAHGLLSLTVNQCNAAPLAIVAAPPAKVKTTTANNPFNSLTDSNYTPPTTLPANTPGALDADLAVAGDFGLTGGPLGKFVNDLPVASKLASGSLDKCHITVVNGVSTQDIAMRLSIGEIKAQGDVVLSTEQFRNFTIFVGPTAIQGLLGPLKGLGGLTDVPITIKGTLSKPQWDIPGSVGTYVKNNALNLGKLPGDIGKFGGNIGKDLGQNLGNLLNPNQQQQQPAQPGSSTQPAQQQPQKSTDPLSNLLKGIEGNKKKKK